MVEAIRQGDIPGVQLRVRQPIALSIEEAWRWLDDAERASRWLYDRVEPFEESGREVLWRSVQEGEAVEEIVGVQRSEPPLSQLVSFRRPGWDAATHVLFEVAPSTASGPNGSELSILHKHFERLPLSDGLTIWEHYRRRWRAATERLAESAAKSTR